MSDMNTTKSATCLIGVTLDELLAERDALRTALEASTELIKTLWDAADDYYTSLHPSIEILTNQQIAANEAVMKGGNT